MFSFHSVPLYVSFQERKAAPTLSGGGNQRRRKLLRLQSPCSPNGILRKSERPPAKRAAQRREIRLPSILAPRNSSLLHLCSPATQEFRPIGLVRQAFLRYGAPPPRPAILPAAAAGASRWVGVIVLY